MANIHKEPVYIFIESFKTKFHVRISNDVLVMAVMFQTH
jgi:hypothetical protein